ncbi:MAG: NADPH-dependent 7-cyano-7-deazaguanine reductase QueF [Pseudomonadales bacterium]
MDNPLGQQAAYSEGYAPDRLYPIARAHSRDELLVPAGALPFRGADVWNAYEFSWLDGSGRPRVAALRIEVDAGSGCIVESKSMKLYLNGFAQTQFDDPARLGEILGADLGAAFDGAVRIEIVPLEAIPRADDRLPGVCLDELGVSLSCYERDPSLLRLVHPVHPCAGEQVHTHLFRSLCPVTGQPDWASILVEYSGPTIDPAALFGYLVSYRRHQAFHEATIEQIFVDLQSRCGCEALTVAGFFLRRGGIDINPFRSTTCAAAPRWRLARQ